MHDKMYDKRDTAHIRSLFDSIAPRYDLANSLLSFHLHSLWNQKLAKTLSKSRPLQVLDLCAGTGEIARRMLKLLPKSHFCLVDLSQEMLNLAQKRLKRANVAFMQQDATALSFAENQFDAVSLAYGIRNIPNRTQAFQEIFRTLRPGARLGIVELTRPEKQPLQLLHKLYLRTFVPLIGKAITSNKEAYRYLCQSIEQFVSCEILVAELEATGFVRVTKAAQTFGIATLIFAEKPPCR